MHWRGLNKAIGRQIAQTWRATPGAITIQRWAIFLSRRRGGRLQFSAGAYSAELLPVEPGTFLALDDGIDVELVHIEDSGFRWGDDQFERVTAP
jgi:hypothetical protein